MKLLSVIHGPTWGGAHNQAATLAGPLARLGVETTVLLPEEATAAAERLEGAGVAARRIPLSRLRAVADPRPNLALALQSRRQIRAITGLIDALGFDLVQVHGPTNPQGALATRGRPDVAVVWQLLDSRTPPSLVRATMPYVVRRADAITSWGQALADLHPPARSLGDRCIPVFPPVPAERFGPDPRARAAGRDRLGLAGDAVAVGTVAVLTPQKGHERLLEALSMLAGSAPAAGPLEARLIGAPSAAHPGYVAGLEARAAALSPGARAELVDPGAEVPALLQALDVFVMASVPRSEGMPTAILEAMVAAKPVVATDVGAVRELVADGETGVVVEANDPGALAAAIGRLLGDAGLRERMGAMGRRRALERFGIEQLARIHHGAYELALEHRRGRLS